MFSVILTFRVDCLFLSLSVAMQQQQQCCTLSPFSILKISDSNAPGVAGTIKHLNDEMDVSIVRQTDRLLAEKRLDLCSWVVDISTTHSHR